MQTNWSPADAAYQGIKNALFRTAVRNHPDLSSEGLEEALTTLLTHWKTEEEKGGVCIVLDSGKNVDSVLTTLMNFGLAYDAAGYYKKNLRNFGIPASPFLIDRSQKGKIRIYSHNNFFHEALLGKKLIELSSRNSPIDPKSLELVEKYKKQEIFDKPNKEQLEAINKALRHNLSIISGGPGTGKTSSVVRILEALFAAQPNARVYVTAPTGKAKSRLIEDLISRPQDFPLVAEAYKDNRLIANTIHMWLSTPTEEGTRLDEEHCLECDILVIDEASMIDSEIAFKLFNVVDVNKTKVIVLGDMYQLAAVGPGAVYADISSPDNCLKGHLTELKTSHRFKGTSGIGMLSKLINESPTESTGNIPQIIALLESHGPIVQVNDHSESMPRKTKKSQESNNLELDLVLSEKRTEDIYLSTNQKINHGSGLTPEAEKWLQEKMAAFASGVKKYLMKEEVPSQEDLEAIWKILNSFKPIAALRKGPMSVRAVNDYCQDLLLSKLGLGGRDDEFYPGKVIIVRKNDTSLGVANGDIAIIFEDKVNPGQWNAYIGDTKIVLKAQLLPEYDPGFCITIHQSQGSGYKDIAVFMPFLSGNENEKNKSLGLATRELLYTAVTRAKSKCHIFSSIEVLKRAIQTKTKRSGGLAARLSEFSELNL